MTTDATQPEGDGPLPAASGGSQDTDTTEPTPGSDGDGAEAGYTPPSASDDPVTD